ncbi:MAG: hypothetical protein ACPG1C_08690 [Alphaproteobacteria bacterium]
MFEDEYTVKEITTVGDCRIHAPPELVEQILLPLTEYLSDQPVWPLPFPDVEGAIELRFVLATWQSEPEYEFVFISCIMAFCAELTNVKSTRVPKKLRGLLSRSNVIVELQGDPIEVPPPEDNLKALDGSDAFFHVGHVDQTHWSTSKIKISGLDKPVLVKEAGLNRFTGKQLYYFHLLRKTNNRNRSWLELVSADPIAANDNFSLIGEEEPTPSI